MNRLTMVPALSLSLALAAAPLLADGLAFEPLTPQGLGADAMQKVAAWQAQMPATMAAFAQNGYGAYGAFAVPKGVALDDPSKFAVTANLTTIEDAKAKTLEACARQTGRDCVVIGLLVPAGG